MPGDLEQAAGVGGEDDAVPAAVEAEELVGERRQLRFHDLLGLALLDHPHAERLPGQKGRFYRVGQFVDVEHFDAAQSDLLDRFPTVSLEEGIGAEYRWLSSSPALV